MEGAGGVTIIVEKAGGVNIITEGAGRVTIVVEGAGGGCKWVLEGCLERDHLPLHEVGSVLPKLSQGWISHLPHWQPSYLEIQTPN